jgi:hypothetical protein
MSSSGYALPALGEDEEDQVIPGLKSLISPTSAAAIVGPPAGTPPDTPPRSQPGVSTPRTGTLDYAPTQATPKRTDGPVTATSLSANSGAINSIAQPLQQPSPSASYGQLMQGRANTPSGGPTAVIRDLNGAPVASGLAQASPALHPVVAATLAARAGNTSTMPNQPAALNAQPGQPAVGTPTYGQLMQRRPSQPGSMMQPSIPSANGNSMAQPSINGAQPNGLAGQYALQRQNYNAQQQATAAPPSMPASASGPGATPVLPNTASPVAPANQQRLAQDQARLAYLTSSGSGISQIKNPAGRFAARAGDVALSLLAPGAEPLIGGTEGRHQVLLGRQQQVVGNDEDQIQKAAQVADTQSQIDEREAQGRNFDARANLYNPEPMSGGQAQALGHPEWEGLKLDARDAERLIGGAARNQTTLQTHFGGQQKTLSQGDAEAINMPSLAGKSMSNDEYQRTLQQVQRNTQSDTNNARTNNTRITTTGMNDQNRITTTGMRDSTSTANSERSHPDGAAGKPIPPAIRDRIQSQKDIAIGKARTSFEQGETGMDEYLDAWQGAQNDYEDRLQAQTGGPIPHTDVRSNVDDKGNWKGNKGAQSNTATPQANPAGKPGSFVTRKGNQVAIGDPVNVNGRKGTVTGFNRQTGKAQVNWQVGR